jgi:ATP-dependent RNA helicase SUPV3L1/SUV3
VTPEIARRLGRLAADEDAAFAVSPDGAVLWRGVAAGQVTGGSWFAPRVRLLGELGPTAARERAQRRLEAWLAAEAGRALKPLARLKGAVESGTLKGLPRGIAFRLIEAGGVIDRREVERDLAALSQVERRTLRTFAVRMGAHSVWLPGVLKNRARALAQAFVIRETFRPGATALTELPATPPSPRLLSAFGLRIVGRYVAAVEMLEALAERQAAARGVLTDVDLAALEVSLDQARSLTTALKTSRAQKPDRDDRPRAVKDSPFAALSALTAPPTPTRAKRKRPRRTRAPG